MKNIEPAITKKAMSESIYYLKKKIIIKTKT